jgi:hypothetical protein
MWLPAGLGFSPLRGLNAESVRFETALDEGSAAKRVRRMVIIFGAGGTPFLQGVFEKNGCKTWCFCGEVVVECVVNVVK